MRVGKPTVSRYLDTRRVLDSGKYTVRLRIEFHTGRKREQHYYSTGVQLTTLEWEKIRSDVRLSDELKRKRKAILAREAEALEIIDGAPFITPSTFDAIFSGRQTRSAMVRPLFDEVITRMKDDDQVTSAELYLHAMDALLEFGGEGLTLNVIDVDWLEQFEDWMLKTPRPVRGRKLGKKHDPGQYKQVTRSVTTLGIYLRNLRAVFNIAITRRIISKDLYPFGRNQYVIPSKKNVKRALNASSKDLLVTYVPEDPKEARALEDWRFSYYSNGMNFSDMAYLKKPDNFRDEIMIYMRRKSSTNERAKESQVVVLRKEALDILSRRAKSGYVFGVITDHMNAVEQKKAINRWIRFTNRHVSKIAMRLNIGKVTTYTGRHTAVSMLISAGVEPWEVKELLGHSSIKTTELYAASLDLEKKRKHSDAL